MGQVENEHVSMFKEVTQSVHDFNDNINLVVWTHL